MSLSVHGATAIPMYASRPLKPDQSLHRPRPTGRLLEVPGASAVSGPGVVYRFEVLVEEGLAVDRESFEARVQQVLWDRRSWGGSGRVAFKRVRSGPVGFQVILASRATTDRLCAPLATNGLYSCHNGDRVVINAWRWGHGATTYGANLSRYRIYVVNHEVGHALGRSHAYCTGADRRAPVMEQQTKDLGGCKSNPWPLAYERG